MDFFGANSEYFSTLVVPVTILVIVLSMSYTMRNILRIWNAGEPQREKPTAQDETDDESADESNVNESVQSKRAKELDIDPVQYCEHIQSQVKIARQRVATKEIKKNLTAEELEKEQEIQRKQIEDIFKLMEQNSEKFGVTSEDEMVQQMRLYV